MENILEWECVLECNYCCPYCTNGHNGVLETPIRYEKDKSKVFAFIDMLKEKWPTTELFLFGGEPFVHPFIDEIIEKLNSADMPYIVQTNGSVYKRIKEIAKRHKFQIQISVHPTEIKNRKKYLEGIIELQEITRRIDVMYTGEDALEYYREIYPQLKNKDILYIAPLADFNIEEDIVNNKLFEFNKLKNSVYDKVYQFEKGERSFKWEDQMKGLWTPKGNPCMYKGKYMLFDPQLKSYTCNYRENNDICPKQQCFLM